MKQSELADRVKLSEAMISKILSGTRRPSWEKAQEIAGVLGCAVSFIMDKDKIDERRKALDKAA